MGKVNSEVLVVTILSAACLVYYVLVYIPRPRGVIYRGSDPRLDGTYWRLTDKTSVRKYYNFSHSKTPWSNEVWQNQRNPAVCIFDHHMDGTRHAWTVGMWDPTNGGQPPPDPQDPLDPQNPFYGRCYAEKGTQTVDDRFSALFRPPLMMQDALRRATVTSSAGDVTGVFVATP